MTVNEWSLVKRVSLLVILAALLPIGAFAYRVLFEPATFVPDSATAPPVLYTLVPGAAGDNGVATIPPTPVVLVVPNGWNEFTVSDDNFAIAVPARWQKLPLNPPELEGSLQVIRRSNPDLATALGARAQELLSTGVKFWAFDFDPNSLQSKFGTVLTITHQVQPNASSFDTFVLVNASQIEQLTSRQGPVNHTRVSLGGFPAEKFRYNMTYQPNGDKPVTTAIVQYLLLNGTNAYVLTYATPLDQLDRYTATFDQSSASFRILAP